MNNKKEIKEVINLLRKNKTYTFQVKKGGTDNRVWLFRELAKHSVLSCKTSVDPTTLRPTEETYLLTEYWKKNLKLYYEKLELQNIKGILDLRNHKETKKANCRATVANIIALLAFIVAVVSLIISFK